VIASVIGFFCYSIYTVSFFSIPFIQEEYKKEHEGNENLVKLNDVFFSLHALAITTIYLVQVMLYRVSKIFNRFAYYCVRKKTKKCQSWELEALLPLFYYALFWWLSVLPISFHGSISCI